MNRFTSLDEVKVRLNILKIEYRDKDDKAKDIIDVISRLIDHIEELEKNIDELDDRTWMTKRTTI